MSAATPVPGWGDFSSTYRLNRLSTLTALMALIVIMLAGIMIGPSGVNVGLSDAVLSIVSHIPMLNALTDVRPDSSVDSIIWQIRVPRILCAAIIGALLGLAGVALQGLLMNPLADPYIVGVSSGAAVGSAFAEVAGFSALLYGFAGAACAFATAVAAVMAVYALARVAGRVSSQTFLLAGVVVGTCLWSLIPLLLVLAGRGNELTKVLFHLLGSLQDVDWIRAEMLIPFAVLAWVLLRSWSRELNLMSLGEESAAHLGVSIEKFKRRVILVASFATAAAVTVAGVIGFVGLVVPHAARRIAGPDHRAIVPLSGLFGAMLLVLSDTLARTTFNEQIPVGVVTSIVGAPVFCYLLRKRVLSA